MGVWLSKVFPVQAWRPEFNSRTHVNMEGKKWLYKDVLWPSHVHYETACPLPHTPPNTHKHTNTMKYFVSPCTGSLIGSVSFSVNSQSAQAEVNGQDHTSCVFYQRYSLQAGHSIVCFSLQPPCTHGTNWSSTTALAQAVILANWTKNTETDSDGVKITTHIGSLSKYLM